jgi:hypothetical protein
MGYYYYAAVAAVKVASVISQANGQAASAGAAKDQARVNSRTALEQGNAPEEIQRRQNALKLGEQRAAAAESGFDPSSGSLATLQSQSAGELELDSLRLVAQVHRL